MTNHFRAPQSKAYDSGTSQYFCEENPHPEKGCHLVCYRNNLKSLPSRRSSCTASCCVRYLEQAPPRDCSVFRTYHYYVKAAGLWPCRVRGSEPRSLRMVLERPVNLAQRPASGSCCLSPLVGSSASTNPATLRQIMLKTALHIARSRLRFEARQWVISKILPKTFGDKLQLKHSGGVASPVITPDMDPIEASRVYQRVMNGDDDREE